MQHRTLLNLFKTKRWPQVCSWPKLNNAQSLTPLNKTFATYLLLTRMKWMNCKLKESTQDISVGFRKLMDGTQSLDQTRVIKLLRLRTVTIAWNQWHFRLVDTHPTASWFKLTLTLSPNLSFKCKLEKNTLLIKKEFKSPTLNSKISTWTKSHLEMQTLKTNFLPILVLSFFQEKKMKKWRLIHSSFLLNKPSKMMIVLFIYSFKKLGTTILQRCTDLVTKTAIMDL